jgi:polygalacturonase
MTNSEQTSLSRRNWLGQLSAASLGSGLLAVATVPAQASDSPAADDRNLGARTYNVREFGAKGDGVTLDSAAVQAAIDACNKDHGGMVLIPAGVFVIGPIEMKSNVTLHISAGGTLLGTDDGKQYHAVDAIPLRGDSTLGDGNVGLIFAVKAENFTIEGPGTIDGNGNKFHSPGPGQPTPAGISGAHRPYHILIHQCQNFRIRDVFMKDSAFHSIRIIQSMFVKLDGIRIHSRVTHNNDGFHFISAQHVHLSNCTIQCQDDACALFGSCKFITVTNCSFSTRWSVFRFGGGEAENISVSNCLIYETYGCPIKMRCGPGARFENISFSNIVMNKVTGPISISLGARGFRRPATAIAASPEAGTPPFDPNAPEQPGLPARPGIVRNITFQGILATVVVPVALSDAFPSHYNPGEIKSCIALNATGDTVIENINLSDIHVTFAGGGTAEEAAVRDVPQITGEYYAAGVLPAYGLFARNVRGLTMQNVRFEVSSPELRPAMVFDHVEDAAVNGFSAQGDKGAESLLRFINSRDVLLTAARILKPAPVFLQVEGANNSCITVDGGDLSKAGAPLALKSGATADAVKLRV